MESMEVEEREERGITTIETWLVMCFVFVSCIWVFVRVRFFVGERRPSSLSPLLMRWQETNDPRVDNK